MGPNDEFVEAREDTVRGREFRELLLLSSSNKGSSGWPGAVSAAWRTGCGGVGAGIGTGGAGAGSIGTGTCGAGGRFNGGPDSDCTKLGRGGRGGGGPLGRVLPVMPVGNGMAVTGSFFSGHCGVSLTTGRGGVGASCGREDWPRSWACGCSIGSGGGLESSGAELLPGDDCIAASLSRAALTEPFCLGWPPPFGGRPGRGGA